MHLRSRRAAGVSRPVLILLGALFLVSTALVPSFAADAPTPLSPASVTAADHPWDDGTKLDVTFTLSPDDRAEADHKVVAFYTVERSGERDGIFESVGSPIIPAKAAYEVGSITTTIDKCRRGEPYYFAVVAVGPDGRKSAPVITSAPAIGVRQWFDGDHLWLGLTMAIVCGTIVACIELARRGWPVKIRRIAGLDAVEEAVGRATEMGRSVFFIAGVQDLNEMQTVAGITVLSHVAKTTAEYDARLEMPTARSLVMTTARETVQASYLAAGRPDSYVEDNIYYVTDEQFGFAAYATGKMVREKPAACFYMGCFFAESLMLAETANTVGAIQIAGTAEPAQLPFFIASCDYTLIGEEFYAASAYLSGDPDQLGSLKGQDLGKIFVACLLLVGSLLVTGATLAGRTNEVPQLKAALTKASAYLTNTMLK
ncbi:MAG TPA: DUF6754 domain-containing protein [Planctomycetaceae bacterium]|jgi:hypothetical protein|nr:DUF6754 domain-containing protein [Planctomycetaceae bacterium]